jgi:hypothetical protein
MRNFNLRLIRYRIFLRLPLGSTPVSEILNYALTLTYGQLLNEFGKPYFSIRGVCFDLYNFKKEDE